ncbi:MAG: FecR family protein, partial [Bryobacteraceae bacterium]|nr:FecR family protein [Bryobacteraceae bacterium]
MKSARYVLIAALAGALAMPLMAQRRGRDRDRRPERETGVARLSSVIGEVTRRHGEGNPMVHADARTPLVSGDWVATATASRAEVRLDESNFIRLGPESEIRLVQLGERSFQVDVIRGKVSYTMLKHGEADVDLRAPNANIVPRKDGVYRVEVAAMDDTRVTVRKGEAEVLTPEHSVILKKNKTLAVRASDHSQRSTASAAPKDSFDDWNQRRDRIMEQDRGPVYRRGGWYPGGIHLGYGWGWGYPWGWGGWGPWGYGGFYRRPV